VSWPQVESDSNSSGKRAARAPLLIQVRSEVSPKSNSPSAQIVLDGVFGMVKEFWPDIIQAVFHGEHCWRGFGRGRCQSRRPSFNWTTASA
jgi:hypothetical protein